METRQEIDASASQEDGKEESMNPKHHQEDKNPDSGATSLPSAYLWKGFAEDLQVKTFDLFCQYKVTSVSLGSQHTLFLTENGLVFAQGSNLHGQLGQGSLEVKDAVDPVQVTGLPSAVTAVASGTDHNAAVTCEGQVYCWGLSREGQCGTGCLDIVPTPALVPVEINTGFCQHGVPNPATPVAVKSVACGASHTLALSCENEIWAWGAGPQLGLDELMHAPVPRRVDALQGKVAVAVCCGHSHSLALVLSKSRSTTPKSSPTKAKTMVSAKSTEVKEDQHYPSRCTVCDNDIYTFTDTSDTCVVDTLHECKSSSASNSAQEVDPTIVEEVFTSSSSHSEREDDLDGAHEKTRHLNKTASNVSLGAKEAVRGGFESSSDIGGGAPDSSSPSTQRGSLLDTSEFLGIPACETSILVINDEENPFESRPGGADARGESGSLGNTSEDVNNVTGVETATPGDTTDVTDDSNAGSNKGLRSPVDLPSKEAQDVGEDQPAPGVSGQDSPGSVGLQTSVVDTPADSKPNAEERKERGDEDSGKDQEAHPDYKQRPRSASNFSVKSLGVLNQSVSEAMEYLQRQFEDDDDDTNKEQELRERGEHAPADVSSGRKGDRRNLSFDNVLGYSSSMMAQVKSMTSRALTNIGTLSVFSSSGQLTEAGGDGEVKTSRPGQDEQAAHSLMSSAGSSSLESAFRDSPDSGTSGSDTQGSLARWSRDISAVDPDPAHVMEGTGQRSLRTIQMQQRNLSSSRQPVGTSAPEGQAQPRPRVVTATEVWVWGKNKHFQLGLGDQLDRSSPSEVKVLKGHHIIKLAAGLSHSLALSANSQVFSWGSNAYGQLNGQLEDKHSPMRIKLSKNCTAWDIGAGENHSVFLGDSANMTPEVFFCGKQPSEKPHGSNKKTNQLVPVTSINKMGSWITGVVAGGENCSCLVLNPAPPESATIFELAATERQFYHQLIKTTNSLLRPLQKCDFYKQMDVYPYKSCLEYMVSAFASLVKKVGEGITDLTRCIQNHKPIVQSDFLQLHEEFIEAFQHYSQTFSNLLAVGGFDFCTKIGMEFFEKIQVMSNNLADERDKPAASTLLLRAMRFPFCRMGAYASLLSRVAEVLKNRQDSAFVQAVSLAWDAQKHSFSLDHKTAEATRMFWESSASKAVADSLRKPSRRMLRESKTYPLHWPSGSRFSNRLFVLFNDIFVLIQASGVAVFRLETVWVDQSTPETENPNAITILTPEDRFELFAPSPDQKAQWLIALNSAISRLVTNQKSLLSLHTSEEQVTPPLVRHATHKFLRPGIYKDATYQGSWLSAKVDGLGIMNFEDGSVYEGHFKRGLMHGPGTRSLVRPGDKEIQRGHWKDGRLNGLATVSYSNGDLYEGYFQDGQRFGHGCYQGGRHNRASCTTTYVGEWNANTRNGYGVQDDILKGEKYMGMWTDDQQHGPGVLVTLDGMYFEGNFVQNKLQGFGLMISDDNTVYEGDFMGTTHLSGKGALTLPSGDKIDGTFNGSLNGGLKVNGIFHKSLSSPDSDKRHGQHTTAKSKYFGRLCVAAESKWSDIFSHTISTLGQSLVKGQTNNLKEKAWEIVAIMVSAGRKSLKSDPTLSASKAKAQIMLLDSLEKIPACRTGKLDREAVEEIAGYLVKAFDAVQHPLGQLMESVGEVFRASYIGVGAHPRLLPHAVQEVRSYVKRIYNIVRILFPALPANGGPMCVYPSEVQAAAAAAASEDKPGTSQHQTSSAATTYEENDDTDDPNLLILTSAGLLYPILLPKIYPPLFDLYALYNERADDLYWERVTKLNRQSDMGLMAYLGVEQRFWLMEDILKQDSSQKLSTIKDVCYAEAVDTLQQLSTAFSPIEKLKVIEQTFNEITKTVSERLTGDVMWCMDDLFPIFQFVVVRAKLQHLGAEIHLVEDLMEAHLEHGEFGIMLTTLKACYFQIQNEKMPHH